MAHGFADIINVMSIAWGVAALMMLLLWWVQVRLKNAGYVDIGWVFGLGISAIIYTISLNGLFLRKAMLCVMALLWTARLGLFLIKRVVGDPKEDRRYAKIRVEWRVHQDIKFFFFFQFQALLDIVLSIVWIPSMLNSSTHIHSLEWLGVVCWIIGFVGEAQADCQLKTFKTDASNKGKTCQVGWWKYSRHPNYFFEWLMWVAYFIFALASPYGWTGLIAPVLMYYFLMHISGVPLAEAQSLKRRGDEYSLYQQTTSMFVPWFKKVSSPNVLVGDLDSRQKHSGMT